MHVHLFPPLLHKENIYGCNWQRKVNSIKAKKGTKKKEINASKIDSPSGKFAERAKQMNEGKQNEHGRGNHLFRIMAPVNAHVYTWQLQQPNDTVHHQWFRELVTLSQFLISTVNSCNYRPVCRKHGNNDGLTAPTASTATVCIKMKWWVNVAT